MELKQIPLFPEHSVSQDGKTIVNGRNKTIVQSPQQIKGKPTGYLYATMLSIDYSAYNKRVAVHRLVAFAWLPKPPTPKHVWINHKDGNKSNNHAHNLEWTTISQNRRHAYDSGLHKIVKGDQHWRYGKKATQATRKRMSDSKRGVNHPKFKGYVYAKFKQFESCNEAGKYLNISGRTVARRIKAEKWRLKGFYWVPKQ